jgi:hypothetical protein
VPEIGVYLRISHTAMMIPTTGIMAAAHITNASVVICAGPRSTLHSGTRG